MHRALQFVPKFTPRFFIQRTFAAAAPATPVHDPDQLVFTFATPDKAIFNHIVVRQVDVPTYAGIVGVLAKHVPTIGIIKPGVVTVTDTDGSMAMNIDGSLQVLAEEAVKIEELDENLVRQELEAAQRKSSEGSDVDKAEAQIRVEVCESMLKALSGGH